MGMERMVFDVKEAARVLSISPWTIRRYLADGKLKAVRIGRHVLIEPSELQRLVEAGRKPRVPSRAPDNQVECEHMCGRFTAASAKLRGRSVNDWLPLSKSLMEDNADFKLLTPGEKVFWLSILSELNLREQFYLADLDWSVTLALSISKIRQARRRFQALGWLKTIAGRYAGRRRLATRYLAARWAKPEDGIYFAPMHRYTWTELVWLVGETRLEHRDLVGYACLCYFWHKFGGTDPDNGGIFITKR